MKRKQFFLVMVLSLSLVFITGCNQTMIANQDLQLSLVPSPTPSPTSPVLLLTDDGITIGTNANCPDRESFGFIYSKSPGSSAPVPDPIHFRWNYYPPEGSTLGWADTCVPTSFTLFFAPAPDYTISHTMTVTPISVENYGGYLFFYYDLYGTLDPHTYYRWWVVGHANGIDIGVKFDNTLDVGVDPQPLFYDEPAWRQVWPGSVGINPFAPKKINGGFQTEPHCDAQTLADPILLNPPDQAVLDMDTPHFQWDMPNCSSKTYRLSIGSSPDIRDFDHEVVFGMEGHLIESGILQPCTVYYWRVQTGPYSIPYHLQMGNYSNSSETRSFIIRTSDCPNVIAVPTLSAPLQQTPSQTPTPLPAQRYNPTETPEPSRYSTATPVVCASFKDQDTCEDHSDSCTWTVPSRGADGYCENKP